MRPHQHVLAHSSTMAEHFELARIAAPRPARTMLDSDDDLPTTAPSRLHRRTLLKLDVLLLPFLALLFLFNSLDKSNVPPPPPTFTLPVQLLTQHRLAMPSQDTSRSRLGCRRATSIRPSRSSSPSSSACSPRGPRWGASMAW